MLDRFNQPQPQPQTPQNRFDMDLPDDEYIQGRDVKRILQQVTAQAPQDPVARAQAAGALYMAIKADPSNKDIFPRWEAEFRNEAAKLPVEHWNLDTLATIARIVRSNHVAELAREMAEQMSNEAHPTIRSGTGGSGGVPQVQQRLDDVAPEGWRKEALAKGITEATVLEFCQVTGQTPEQYMAELTRFGKGGVIHG